MNVQVTEDELATMKFGIGQPVPRGEDPTLLTGKGQYTDDIVAENLAHAVFLRSPYPNAEIGTIDLAAARAAPGVLAVLTAEDVGADGLGDLPCQALIPGSDGKPAFDPGYPLLARGRVRHVGDPVAMILA